MDSDWFWLIVPATYFILSLLCLRYPKLHAKHRYSLDLYNQLADGQALLCIGHRGGGYEGPENTLELFRRTLSIAHMFELDVCITRDHQLVIHHDKNLHRTTGHDMDIHILKAQDLPPFQKQFHTFRGGLLETENNRIPLLETLFEEFPDTLLNIDLKTPTKEAVKEFARLMRKYARHQSTIWGAAMDESNRQLREEEPSVISFYSSAEVMKIFLLFMTGLLPFWPLEGRVLEIPLYTSSMGDLGYGIAVATSRYQRLSNFVIRCILRLLSLLSTMLVPHLRKRGIITFYWIVNDQDGWDTAVSAGSRGIITDIPSRLAVYLKSRGLYFERPSDSF